MKNLIKLLFVFIICLSTFSYFNASAESNKEITIYFFHGDGCPHCAAEEVYLEELKDEFSNLKIVDYEVWYNDENKEFFDNVREKFEINDVGVPLTIIGSTKISGYNDEASTGAKIKRAITYYQENKYTDIISKINDDTFEEADLEEVDFDKVEEKTDEEATVELPILGKSNLKLLPLSSSLLILGIINSFSLNTLIILLLGTSILLIISSRRKKWLFGLVLFITLFLGNTIILTTDLSILGSYLIYFEIALIILSLIMIFINIKNYLTYKKDEYIKKSSIKSIIVLILLIVLSIVITLLNDTSILTNLLSINNIFGMESLFYVMEYTLCLLLFPIILIIIIMFLLKNKHILKLEKYYKILSSILFTLTTILILFNII